MNRKAPTAADCLHAEVRLLSAVVVRRDSSRTRDHTLWLCETGVCLQCAVTVSRESTVKPWRPWGVDDSNGKKAKRVLLCVPAPVSG